ncbi:MAG: GNAT family N-acetyltransferase [Pseudomonadota bacterium]|uniref:GNAT family N-acetyltransferase n=1 Tax=Burkholderia sp. PAMC 26561 TaxID=1795043 RepID=UPI00076AED1C|nr:GNAT family N-acetyltransferase [Burkholderia sp. PAMC 26561]AME24700.1 hypothetical protein AXG89_13415 [Burkholderia sp. PAMC 26561]MDP9154924.1 GNAT family N-acetyltransferase [Pseudomonadota bacterium]
MFELKELEDGDFRLIAATNGGAAWKADRGIWNRYLQESRNGERHILLALDEQGRAVGYGNLLWASDYRAFRQAGVPEINNLVVASSVRRSGIATRLIAKFEQYALGQGKTTIGIGVGLYADYGPAQSLYVKLGYRPDGNGVSYNYEPVPPGSNVPFDDDLVLWMTKQLKP